MSAAPQTFSLGAAVGLAALMAAGGARAQESEAFALAWKAPAGCPETAEVRAEVVRLLGGSIAALSGGRLQAHAEVTQGPPWAVSLATESAGQGGQRFLEAGSCRELAHATALIVALMIDPDAVAAHASAEPPPAPAPRALAPKPARNLDFEVGAILAGTQGTLPSPDLGLGGILGVSGKRWRLDGRASYGLRRDQKASAPLPPGSYGQFNFFSAQLAACLNLGGERAAWGPCAVGEFGVVSAKGIGVDRALPAHVPWWAVGAGGYVVVPLARHWAVPFHLEALLPLRRSEYVFRDDQGNVSARVFKAARLGIRASVGVELHF